MDINVHPRKSEVKFSDDKPVFKAVYNSILQALEHPTHHVTANQEETVATAIDYDKVFTGRSQGFTVMRENRGSRGYNSPKGIYSATTYCVRTK